ncbi:MAG TPA: phosphoribosylglycinamide formyltransferase [Bacteroidetes bacterium]|nr:phosphoribosylglycinamide formyltransferase [Bacteroidota bacterium]
MSTTLQLGVLASGRGSNFAAILDAISQNKLDAKVKVLISNKQKAGALEIAAKHNIPAVFVSQKKFSDPASFDGEVSRTFEEYEVDFVVLAGYLRLLSQKFVRRYKNRILNIHPALLPSFGGQGMYGHHVQEAVLGRGCKVSGVTVHLVDELFDHGPIVKQRCVPVLETDSADSLAARVLVQEHQVFAEALQLFAENRVEIENHRAIILPGKEKN